MQAGYVEKYEGKGGGDSIFLKRNIRLLDGVV